MFLTLHHRFVIYSASQIYSGDFSKFCGLLRIMNFMIKVLDYPSSTTYFLNILLPLLETISSSLLHFFFLTFMFNLAHNLQFLGRSLFSNVRKIQPSPVFFSIDSYHAQCSYTNIQQTKIAVTKIQLSFQSRASAWR